MLARASFIAFVALFSAAAAACGDGSPSGAASGAASTGTAAGAAAGTGKPAPVPAGTGKPSAAECEAMSQHFLDLAWQEALAEDEELRNSSDVEKELIRKASQSKTKNDPDFQAIAAACRKEISRKELDCLMAAKTTQAFEKCAE